MCFFFKSTNSSTNKNIVEWYKSKIEFIKQIQTDIIPNLTLLRKYLYVLTPNTIKHYLNAL